MTSNNGEMRDLPAKLGSVTKKLIHRGGNSTVYEWQNSGGCYIAKEFSGNNKNIEERFERERNSLILLEHNRIKNVPRLIHADSQAKIIITNKLGGTMPEVMTFDLFKEYHNLTKELKKEKLKQKGGLVIKSASDSLLEPAKLVDKVENDFDKIMKDFDGISQMSECFCSEVHKVVSQARSVIRNNSNKSGIYDEDQVVFSFSDLGPRNILVDNAKVNFLDFEHAGWDDPAKGIIDLIICPTNKTSKKDIIDIIKWIAREDKDNYITNNLIEWMPILNVKWVLIYIMYNMKLHQQQSLEIDEIQRVFIRGKNTVKYIKDLLESKL